MQSIAVRLFVLFTAPSLSISLSLSLSHYLSINLSIHLYVTPQLTLLHSLPRSLLFQVYGVGEAMALIEKAVDKAVNNVPQKIFK